MIDAYAELSGDRTPLHINEEHARMSHFGERVARGLFGLSVWGIVVVPVELINQKGEVVQRGEQVPRHPHAAAG